MTLHLNTSAIVDMIIFFAIIVVIADNLQFLDK